MEAITTTLGALVNAAAAIGRLVQRPLAPKVAYDVAKIARLAEPEIQHYHRERDRWVKELGEVRAATDEEIEAGEYSKGERVWQLKPDNVEEFNKRMAELTVIPVTLAWRKVALEALGTAPLTAADLLALDQLIDVQETVSAPAAPAAG